MRAALLLLGALAATPATARTVTLKPLVDARLRYESVDQNGLARDADALTARLRIGLQASTGPWSALVEGEGTAAFITKYDDGLHGTSTRPLVGDPENIALYRAQLGYRTKELAVTAGRQRIALDDERFVGAANFRQNGQTFDAVRAEVSPMKGLKLDVSYAGAARTIWGIDGNGARPVRIGGDYVFANASYATPVGTLVGFGYLVDEDRLAVQGYRLSSQTYGARLAGTRPIGKAKLGYQLSFARQSDYDRNPNRYVASYYLVDATLDLNGPKLGAGYEVLGASSGVALTSLQTPVATNFKFQGWADKFLTTPPDGVRDLYGSAGLGWKQVGSLKAVALQAVYHRFESDRLVRHYGNEIDLLASAKVGAITASVRYADYDADMFATNTRKLWLQLDWTL